MLIDHLEKLVHFAGIAQAGSLRKYATSKNLSQPAMTKCIQILETDLQTVLMIRDRNGIQLTQSGRKLLEWAEKLMTESDRVASSLRLDAGNRLSGRITMGTYQSIAVYFAPKLYKFLVREQIQIEMSFVTAPSSDLLKQLKAGAVDFIISIEPPNTTSLHQTVLYQDTYSLFKPAVDLKKTTQPEIFTLPDALDQSGRSIRAYMKKEGMADQLISCGDFETVKAMLEAGAGWAVLPELVAAPALEAKKIERVRTFPSLQFFGKHSIVFSCKAHRANDDAICWIENQLRSMLTNE